MGQAIAAIRDTLTAPDEAAKENIQEQLTFLVNAANSKLDRYQADLDMMFVDSASVSKRVVPGYRALRWERGYRVGLEKSASAGPVGDVVNAFFGSGDDVKDNANPILSGFKKLVLGSLDAILGNANAGEQEEQKFFVFVHHNAIIRIDTKIWRYNFNGKGVMAQSENVFCYVFCTSVVNHNALEVDELTYLFSEHTGDTDVEAYVDKLVSVWTKILSISEATGGRLAQTKNRRLKTTASSDEETERQMQIQRKLWQRRNWPIWQPEIYLAQRIYAIYAIPLLAYSNLFCAHLCYES